MMREKTGKTIKEKTPATQLEKERGERGLSFFCMDEWVASINSWRLLGRQYQFLFLVCGTNYRGDRNGKSSRK